MDSRQWELLRQIQELQFVAVELTLYMDIHDDHRQPLMEYNQVTERLRALTMDYERRYGPLMPYGQSPVQRWAWVDEPWPWEM